MTFTDLQSPQVTKSRCGDQMHFPSVNADLHFTLLYSRLEPVSCVCTGERARESQSRRPLLTHTAAERKQWKTNISGDDKTRYKPQHSDVSLDVSLGRSWTWLFFIVNSRHSHICHVSSARRLQTDWSRSLLFIVGIKGNIPCVERRGWSSCTVHGVSWANGVASLQTVWLQPPSLDRRGFSPSVCLRKVKRRTTLDDFDLSSVCRRRLTVSPAARVPNTQKRPSRIRGMKAQTTPTHAAFEAFNFQGFDFNSVLFPTGSWKDNVGLFVKNNDKNNNDHTNLFGLTHWAKATQCFNAYTRDSAEFGRLWCLHVRQSIRATLVFLFFSCFGRLTTQMSAADSSIVKNSTQAAREKGN